MGNVLNGIYYMLDGMDDMSDKLLTPEQISGKLYLDNRELSENDIKTIAADREADLYRYVYRDGELLEKKRLLEITW